MKIQYFKKQKLLNRQIVCLVIAVTPMGAVAFATGLFPWIWFLLIPGVMLLLLESLLLSHWKAQEMGDPRAKKNSSSKKRKWAKVFWFANFLFLFGGWEILEVEKLVFLFYFMGYGLFQYWAFVLIFKGKK